jgi:hypothetical protein
MCSDNKKKYRCLSCDNEQIPGAYCQQCYGTELVSIGAGIPDSGVAVRFGEMILISLGEINDRGGLRCSLPGYYPEYWGAIVNWKVV